MRPASRERFRVGDAVVSAVDVGEGAPIILLHGIPTGAPLWADVVEPLAGAGLRVVAPDLPGYGDTHPGASDDWSLAGAARLLARWARQQGLAGAWVVGHDAGGAVAQLLAVEHPGLVARLTLVNSIVDGSWPAPRARFAKWAARLGLYRPAAAWGIVPNRWLRWQISRGFADPGRMATVDEDAVFWDTKFTDPAGRRAFERHVAALDADDTARVVTGLRRLEVPCQLVWGMQDVFQPWSPAGRRLQEILPDPAVTRLADCGHLVPLECPDQLVAALLDWRAEVPA